MLKLNYLKFNFPNLRQFYSLKKLNFNNVPDITKNQPPAKTKEQIKVETLMQQWPEYVSNPPKYAYNLQEAKEVLEDIYKFHQGDKKYLGPVDLPKEYSADFVCEVNNSKTTDAVADFFLKFQGFLPDHIIMEKFFNLAFNNGEKTNDLYQIILPQVKKLILNADRQTTRNLYLAVAGGAMMNLTDTEFWDIIEFKLTNERLYRYLELGQATEVAFHLVNMRKGSKTLLKNLEMYFIKHRKAISMDRNMKERVGVAYSICGASNLLFDCLEDPNIQLPEMEPPIPQMTKATRGDPRWRTERLPEKDKKQLEKLHH